MRPSGCKMKLTITAKNRANNLLLIHWKHCGELKCDQNPVKTQQFQFCNAFTWLAPHRLQMEVSQTPLLPPPLQGVCQSLQENKFYYATSQKKNSHQNCCVYELSCVTRTRERGHQEVMMQELSIHRPRLSTILSPFTTKFTYTVYIFLCIKVKRNITSGVRQDSTWFTVTQDKISVSR